MNQGQKGQESYHNKGNKRSDEPFSLRIPKNVILRMEPQ